MNEENRERKCNKCDTILIGKYPMLYCPKCKQKRTVNEVYSRTVGYIRPLNQWNLGKQTEFKLRKMINVSSTQW